MNKPTAVTTNQRDRFDRSTHGEETTMPLFIAQIFVSGHASSGRRK
jgi:hypothetical protein